MSTRLLVICRQIDVGVLLDAFVRSRDYVPHDAHRIRSREELPLALQSHARQADSVVWRAWSDGSRIRFVKAKPVSCEDAAGLQVTFFDVDGHSDRSGAWIWLRIDWCFAHQDSRQRNRSSPMGLNRSAIVL